MAPFGLASHSTDDTASELKALERRVLGKRGTIWGGVAAVIVPLAVLLGLQYWWLADLEKSSAIAHKATLQNYLDAVAKDVHVFYLKIAERSLNLPEYVFMIDSDRRTTEERLAKTAQFFKKKDIEGAKRLFMVRYSHKGEHLYVFDRESVSMVKPEFSTETLSVWAAIAPWRILWKKGACIDTTVFSVEQRDPDNRIIINPITNEQAKLIGLAGLVVDRKYFETVVLPKAIESAIPKFKADAKLRVCVRDSHRKQVYPTDGLMETGCEQVSRAFTFIFSDWVISLNGDFAAPEEWARATFAFNMTLSVALAAVLIGGVALTLRTTLREMRLSAMKNEFVSNVSHELRTPLSSIRVFGEFMRRGRVGDPEKVREYGSYIETESRRLTQLINNILDFSRIESGRRVYSFETADLEEVIHGTLSTFSVRLRNRGFDLVYNEPDEPLPELWMDANAIDRALANLLDNAVKYSNGGSEIIVGLERRDDHAVISVADHGIGIPRDEQQRIFERFHRVSTGLVHDVKGSGLGLSLVQHIVQAHGGWVTVDSEIGKGSTFTIFLPLVSDPDDPAGKEPENG